MTRGPAGERRRGRAEGGALGRRASSSQAQSSIARAGEPARALVAHVAPGLGASGRGPTVAFQRERGARASAHVERARAALGGGPGRLGFGPVSEAGSVMPGEILVDRNVVVVG